MFTKDMYENSQHCLNSAEISSILFIGAGASSTSALTNLLQELSKKKKTSDLKITIVEKGSLLGSGLAYGTDKPYYLFNSRANKVGIVSGDRNHFFKWMMQNKNSWQKMFPEYANKTLHSDSFVPRGIYGLYLQYMFDIAVEGFKERGVKIELIEGEAIDGIELHKKGYVKIVDSNKNIKIIEADKVVVGIGNPPPTKIQKLTSNPCYTCDPWSSDFKEIPKNAKVIIVGMGLTGMDALISLQAQNHSGSIELISRHNLLSELHGGILPAYKRTAFTMENVKTLSPPTADNYYEMLKEDLLIAQKNGVNWRSVIDSLRENSESQLQSGSLRNQSGFKELWKMLSEDEKLNWNIRYDSWFNALRFRLPPESWERIEPIFKSGQVKTFKVDVNSDKFFPNPEAYYINCTGPDLMQNLFIKSLSSRGICQMHPAGGIRADETMYLKNIHGKASNIYSAIGPLRKGEDFETVNIVEIVDQTKILTAELSKNIFSKKPMQMSRL